ncbi:MAG: DUF1015 domain-containing protein [Clostridia bacterium]|nr:DUF1015 domain-containing protein [Clostridia bacterium]
MASCFSSASVLLPDFDRTDALRWAVIACDQFTSEPAYWQEAETLVGSAPSTLRLILPEVYLSETEQRLPAIGKTMRQYEAELLQEHPHSMLYVERTQSDGTLRCGLILAVDLEQYDYRKGASSLIRSTEATVAERIPPRVAVRRNASLELPHVMLLIDDPDRTVIEPLSLQDGQLAYDTDLMLGGGHITGVFLSTERKEQISCALEVLASPEAMKQRYGNENLAPLLFAVGDGNHSLASAQALYEEIKGQLGEAAKEHPARYALVEVVNLHDPALQFEPIYRVLFHVDPTDAVRSLTRFAQAQNGKGTPQSLRWITKEMDGEIVVEHPLRQLCVGTLQEWLDTYLAEHPEASVDYIHGEESVCKLANHKNAIGFLFEGMGKDSLFPTVMFDGALPRKTFSMGHAEDKRYYMECRRIR